MTTYQSDSPNTQTETHQKPAELVESRLIEAILNGTFPPTATSPLNGNWLNHWASPGPRFGKRSNG